MSDSPTDERERIRERKKRELLERLEDGSPGGGVADEAAAANGAPGTDAAVEDAPEAPIPIRGEDHLETVVDDHDVVLVDCYADWCGPCRMLEPTVETIAAETPAAVAKVDTDAHRGLAQRLGVQGLPTLVLYADGEPVERLVGMQDRARLEGLVERHA